MAWGDGNERVGAEGTRRVRTDRQVTVGLPTGAASGQDAVADQQRYGEHDGDGQNFRECQFLEVGQVLHYSMPLVDKRV